MADFSNNELRSIFQKASELSEKDREKYVEEACGENAQLREGVQRLLDAHDLDTKIETKADPVSRTDISGQIGRFRILQRIGEGGFGEVWMAEQLEPISRRVAIKIIKPGMDSKQVVARFEAERQALAMMEHANIARVYDGGQTEEGRPYFVMELVKGLPITEYCSRKNLGLPERLRLFQHVCEGVQHAHQRGIIHRDLKPTNILVGEIDGKAVPKVIDFGIAKALERPLTDKTLFTEFRQFIGTPEYMSPEQAELSLIDVDTRSDVYALGVLLYELLTEKPPFDPESLRSAGFDEMRRIIREDEPPAPSLILSGTARGIEAPNPDLTARSKLVRGELDWIVQRAMAKERDRRYSSAKDLEDDIDRYTRGEAVEAGPPGHVYRMARFVRRHRAAVIVSITGIAALVLIAILLATGLIMLSKSYQELQVAQKNELSANLAMQSSLKDRTDALARTEAVSKKLANQAAARLLANASEASVTDQRHAVLELDEIPSADSNWLTKMLTATLPTRGSIPDFEKAVHNTWVLDVSPDGTRAVLVVAEKEKVHVDLVSLEIPGTRRLIKHLYSTEKFYDDVYGYENAFRFLDNFVGNVLGLLAFSPDGTRIVVSPILQILGEIGKYDEAYTKGEARRLFDTSDLDWHVKVFSSRTGEEIGRFQTPPKLESDAPLNLMQLATSFLPSYALAMNADASRIVVVLNSVVTCHDVKSNRSILEMDINPEISKKPLLCMSPSGESICVGSQSNNPKDSPPKVILLNGDAPIALAIEERADVIALPNDTSVLVLNELNELLEIDLSTNTVNARIDVSARTERPYIRTILQPIKDSRVLLQNGRWLEHVDMQKELVIARTDIGRSNPLVTSPPSDSNPGSLLMWSPVRMDKIFLGSPVAIPVRGTDRGWAPSTVVSNSMESHEQGEGIISSTPYMVDTPYGQFETGQMEKVTVTAASDGTATSHKRITNFSEPVGTVSPYGKFVVTAVVGGMRIFNSNTGEASYLQYLNQRPGEEKKTIIPVSYTNRGVHCWAMIEGELRLVVAGLMKDGPNPSTYVLGTWNPEDGKLLEHTQYSPFISSDELAAQGFEGMQRSMVFPVGYSVSVDGNLIAISGILIEGPNFKDSSSSIQKLAYAAASNLHSTVIIVERSTGKRVRSYVYRGAGGPLAFSPDGSTIATLVASELDYGIGSAQVRVFSTDSEKQLSNTFDVPSIYFDGKTMFTLWRSPPGRVLSFSTDGELLSVALPKVIDLFDMRAGIRVMRIDWPRIVRMLDISDVMHSTDEFGSDVVFQSGSRDFNLVQFQGAAFSPEGNEFRINIDPLTTSPEIAMIRIFDSPIE